MTLSTINMWGPTNTLENASPITEADNLTVHLMKTIKETRMGPLDETL